MRIQTGICECVNDFRLHGSSCALTACCSHLRLSLPLCWRSRAPNCLRREALRWGRANADANARIACGRARNEGWLQRGDDDYATATVPPAHTRPRQTHNEQQQATNQKKKMKKKKKKKKKTAQRQYSRNLWLHRDELPLFVPAASRLGRGYASQRLAQRRSTTTSSGSDAASAAAFTATSAAPIAGVDPSLCCPCPRVGDARAGGDGGGLRREALQAVDPISEVGGVHGVAQGVEVESAAALITRSQEFKEPNRSNIT